ncbi:MAG: restriction endonuclease [Methylocella sp.]
MANIRSLDMLFLDDLLDMSGGYVLRFSDRTFAEFFSQELNVNIDDPKYAKSGTSKGKRLRHFLQTESIPTVVKTLNALWEYREALRVRSGQSDKLTNAHNRLLDLLNRLQGGESHSPPHDKKTVSVPNKDKIGHLKNELFALPSLAPQPRGFAFERFLKSLFDCYGLEARDAFRNRGEQIDGSFLLSNEVYLLEAKWQTDLCGVADLHGFHGKIEQKAAWTRGLFISNSGFSKDGLVAFGRGKRVICMDGYDLYEVLTRELSLAEVLDRKVRHAAETGTLFARVRDLFTS